MGGLVGVLPVYCRAASSLKLLGGGEGRMRDFAAEMEVWQGSVGRS